MMLQSTYSGKVTTKFSYELCRTLDESGISLSDIILMPEVWL